MPKKIGQRVIRFLFAKTTKKENEKLKAELTEALKEIVYKEGFLLIELLGLLILVASIILIVQYFLTK